MEDYKIYITELLLKWYSPTDNGRKKTLMSTLQLLELFRGVIPKEPIDEHDIFQIMKEQNFQTSLEVVTEKVCIFAGDKDKGIPPEYNEVEVGRVFCWVLYANQ
ncbi:MAG: hypothetical protein ACTTJM_00760 [Bergeyella cardium]